MLKLGTTDINGLYLGSTAINQAYLGSTEVFGQTLLDFSGVETLISQIDWGYQDSKSGGSFNSDGTRLYLQDTTAAPYYIQQYDLTTPYDVSTKTNLVQASIPLNAVDLQIVGNYLFVSVNGGYSIRRYTLNNGSVSGMTYNYDSGNYPNGNLNFYITEDGNYYGLTGNPAKIYATATPFVLSSSDTVVSTFSGFSYVYGLSNDGKYYVNYSTVYNLTTPFDLNTRVSVGALTTNGVNVGEIRMTSDFSHYLQFGTRATNYPTTYSYSTGQSYN